VRALEEVELAAAKLSALGGPREADEPHHLTAVAQVHRGLPLDVELGEQLAAAVGLKQALAASDVLHGQ
jgi:hypothetical protein